MCAVTHRAKPYQLALLIKKSLDDVIGSHQNACEATVQYQCQNIHFSFTYALFAESSIDTFKKMFFIYIIYQIKLPLCVSFKAWIYNYQPCAYRVRLVIVG